MENLYTYYIYEELNNDAKSFFNKIYKTQRKLIDGNKINKIIIEPSNLKKTKKAFELNDLNERELIDFLGDNLLGMPILYDILKNFNKYIKDGDHELSPQCYLYFYINNKNIYLVGNIIFDDQIYIDNFKHILNFEVSKIVKNTPEMLKAILIDYCNLIKKEDPKKQIKGLSAKPINAKQKKNMIKLGFTSLKDDKELMTIELK